MFTNQYIAYRRMKFLALSGVTFTSCDGYKKTNTTYGWGTIDIGACMKTARCQTPTSVNPGIYFGTGTTPPQVTDIKLEQVITSGLAITNSTVLELEVSDGVYEISASFILRNTSGSDITISEVGCIAGLDYGSNTFGPVLFERTVLSNPITIASGESKLLTYKLIFNQSQ